ncbi:Dyp-type peroxidase [Nocardioides marmorisolisilvae]|uniref:Dyp-type peroxidase n=1 Tax=Nocardioides marmorisolisilvae TaxID=1542737 RepID=A0A3N0DR09_9ACTN|nr:Dyp-type peroxidase [Nocardioides marmorisolisilvae]RNL77773.1 Dyp-type peroxidase [Nocardioides marmorisolisilvae]
MTGPSRRALLQGAAGLAALSACSSGPEQGSPTTAYGVHQAGVTTAQQGFGNLVVLDLHHAPIVPVLEALGEEIERLVSGRAADVPEPGDLTVTVGVADPGLVLPTFARDTFGPEHCGGDLVLQVCGSDPVAVLAASDRLTRDHAVRWSQLGFSGAAGKDGFGRNLLGFHDGIVQPRGREELSAGVWGDDGSTVMVVRRIVLDVEGFNDLAVDQQEAVIGRRKSTGAPLSGGHLTSPLDLAAKTPAGAYLIPVDAHVRRAHPLATGRPLMLRRGYSFAGEQGSGLLFISFQRDLAEFIQTQYRLDAGDALNRYLRVTASGVFRVLPGFSASRGLGASMNADR